MAIQEQNGPPINCADCAVGRSSIYCPTLLKDPGSIAASRKAIVSLPAERTLFRAGEIPDTVYTIHTGWAYRAIELSGSRRQIISFLIPGDITPMETVCFSGVPQPYHVRSLTPVHLCKFPLDRMIQILHEPDAQLKNSRDTFQEYSTAMNRRIADIGRRSATGRIAQLILEIHDRLKARHLIQNGEFAFPPRQDDIADALGLTSVHVSRILVELRKRELVEFRRGAFRIRDMNSLRQIASDE